ncbi:MAG: divalent metal cation transporter, partial [Pseudomonadota bacterium]
MKQLNKLLSIFGPGIVLAATAIGGSHLVQSTRAGADYGLKLLPVVILANLLKYPFFEFGQRYFAMTGKNLLHGYEKLHPLALYAFLISTLITAVPTLSAVSFVAANILAYFIAPGISPFYFEIVILFVCAAILLLGHYRLLDLLIKLLLIILTVATCLALILTISHTGFAVPHHSSVVLNLSSLAFIIALVGWMPAPVEASVWLTLWGEANRDSGQQQPTLKSALVDFNVGYIGTAILAVIFVLLGALVMHGMMQSFASSGIKFTEQFVNLYTIHIGAWSKPIIVIVAFATMFSTTLTVLDAYPRSICAALKLINAKSKPINTQIYWLSLTIILIIAAVTTRFFLTKMTVLIDIATTTAFLMAPIFAYLNYVLLTSSHIQRQFRPSKFLIYLARLG